MFQLAEETPTHYLVKHPKGDSLKIAKKGLSPQMHEQIKKFSSGGQAPKAPAPSPAPQPTQPTTGDSISKGFNGAMGLPHYDAGVVIPDNSDDEETAEPTASDNEQNSSNPQDAMSLAHKALDTVQMSLGSNSSLPTPGGISPSDLREKMLSQNQPQAGGATADATDIDFKPSEQAPPQQRSAFQNVNLPGAQAPQPTPALPDQPGMQRYINDLQANRDESQKAQADIMSRAKQIQEDLLNGHIDFNNFWKDKSTGQKIGAGIAMLFGGLGAGLTHGPNMAYQVINDAINRDVESQKANLGKKQTALDAYLKEYGDIATASSKYREDTQALVAARMQQYNMNMQRGMYNQMAGPQGQGGQQGFLNYLRMFNPEVAKEQESRLIPGIGQANIPVAQEDREEITKRVQLQQQLNELKQFASQHAGSQNPAIKNQAAEMTRAAGIAQMQANKIRIRPGEKDPSGTLFPDPTSFLPGFRSTPQYDQAMRDNQMALQTKLSAYGIGGPGNAMPQGMPPQGLTQRTIFRTTPPQPQVTPIANNRRKP